MFISSVIIAYYGMFLTHANTSLSNVWSTRNLYTVEYPTRNLYAVEYPTRNLYTV